MATFEQVKAAFPDADIVGGEVVVFADGVHQVLGFFNNGIFNSSGYADQAVETIPAEAPAEKPKRKSKAAEDIDLSDIKLD